MASELAFYSIYRDRSTECYVLLRTIRPGFPNYSETQADHACDIEQTKREVLLNYVADRLGTNRKEGFELIGQLQDSPIGEVLAAASGGVEIDVFYLHTEFGHPWIIVGNASSEAEFLKELHGDEDLLSLRPVGVPVTIKAKCFAENDVVFPDLQ